MSRGRWLLTLAVGIYLLILLVPSDFVPVKTAGNVFSASVSESRRRNVFVAVYKPSKPALNYGPTRLEFDICWVEKSWQYVGHRTSNTLPSEENYNFIVKLKNRLKGSYPGGNHLKLRSARLEDSELSFPYHGERGFEPRGFLGFPPGDTLRYIVTYDSVAVERRELDQILFVRQR